MADKDRAVHSGRRKLVQALWGFASNGYLPGFIKGKIYTGPLKHFCVPGLNCYSCPGALGACPIGSMQAFFDSRSRRFSFYVVGFIAAIGLLVGRFVCGRLCLFGLIEELLYRIPTPKLHIPSKADRMLRYFKYAVLFIMVFALPFFVRDSFGTGYPFFCKYLCPVGTLEGGIPLVLAKEGFRDVAGGLFAWKMGILILCILACIFIYRPFCKYVCPLGAFYALFSRISILRMIYDESACVHCGACTKTCKMDVDPTRSPNSAECIRCGECIRTCPRGAIRFTGLNSQPAPACPDTSSEQPDP